MPKEIVKETKAELKRKNAHSKLDDILDVLFNSETEKAVKETPAEEEMAPEKVAEIRSAMSQLNAMLPEDQRVVIKSEEPDELSQILAAIKDLKKTDDDPPAKEDDPPDSLKDILKRLIKVEKTTGVSDGDGEEEGEDVLLPDVVLTEEDRIKKYGTKYPKAVSDLGHDLQQ